MHNDLTFFAGDRIDELTHGLVGFAARHQHDLRRTFLRQPFGNLPTEHSQAARDEKRTGFNFDFSAFGFDLLLAWHEQFSIANRELVVRRFRDEDLRQPRHTFAFAIRHVDQATTELRLLGAEHATQSPKLRLSRIDFLCFFADRRSDCLASNELQPTRNFAMVRGQQRLHGADDGLQITFVVLVRFAVEKPSDAIELRRVCIAERRGR